MGTYKHNITAYVASAVAIILLIVAILQGREIKRHNMEQFNAEPLDDIALTDSTLQAVTTERDSLYQLNQQLAETVNYYKRQIDEASMQQEVDTAAAEF